MSPGRLVNVMGDGWMAVVGESFYSEAIDRLTGGGVGEFELPCRLVREPENEYDANAIAVLVNGAKVGHLSRDNAARFRAGLDAVGGEVVSRAVIRRGSADRPWNIVLQVDYATLDGLPGR